MTAPRKLLVLLVGCVLTVGLVLALDQFTGTGTAAQEPPPPVTCNDEGACVLVEDEPYTIECDEHAGTGCNQHAPEPVPATPAFTG